MWVILIFWQKSNRDSKEKIPEKKFIFNNGFCHGHTNIYKEELEHAKELHPDALVLAHPECKEEVLVISDFIASFFQI